MASPLRRLPAHMALFRLRPEPEARMREDFDREAWPHFREIYRAVGVQWESPGTVARRDQRHALGFFLNPAP